MKPFAAILDDLEKLRMDVGLDGALDALAEGDRAKSKQLVSPTLEPIGTPAGEPAKEPERGATPAAGRAPRRRESEKKGVEFLDDVFRKLGKRSDIDHESEIGNYPEIGPGTFVTLWDRDMELMLSAFVSDDEDKVMLYAMKIEKSEQEMERPKDDPLDISDAGYDDAVTAAVAFARKLV